MATLALAPIDLKSVSQGGGIKLNTLTDIVNAVVTVLLPLAGLVLLLVIISAGFQMLTGLNNPDAVKKGRTTLTYGIVGFIIVFAAYWLAQIVETIFGFPIVSK